MHQGLRIILAAAAASWSAGALALTPVETPMLAPLVAAGKLPSVDKRLPGAPLVVAETDNPASSQGEHGGELQLLMGSSRDTRLMVVYGYARPVVYNPKFEIEPDLLERIEVEDNRVFTLHLRPGHRWSDGHPHTAEDYRYFWDDVLNNERLYPVGPPTVFLVDGERPKFEVLSETAVRYTWSKPNAFFLPSLAGALPNYLCAPAHYLRQFHERYADPAKLREAMRAAGVRNWAVLHNRLDNQYRNDNPELPTLQPWVLQTKPPSERFVFTRNPYYHRIDSRGRQLPYIDQVVVKIADGKLIPVKTGAGETHLQARSLSFSDYTFLKQGEKQHGYSVRLWRTGYGSRVALMPNLNVNDDVWRTLLRDARFRRALSLAIDRHEVNQVNYYGLAVEQGNAVLPQSPLYRPGYANAWARFDLKQANALLDEIGMTKRDSRGVRLLPDGRPAEIIIETAGEETEQVDVLQLVHDSWMQAGIKLYTKPSQREVFRNRIFAGETVMSVWFGLENGIPTPAMSPADLAPTTQAHLQWPKWGQYIETGGKSGQPVDVPEAQELARLNDAWRLALTEVEREAIWHRMLAIFTDQVYTIGIVAGVLQPVVMSNRLKGAPADGLYTWDPGAHFGMYRPDSWWLADKAGARRADAAADRKLR